MQEIVDGFSNPLTSTGMIIGVDGDDGGLGLDDPDALLVEALPGVGGVVMEPVHDLGVYLGQFTKR